MLGTIVGGFLGWIFGLALGSGFFGLIIGIWLGRRFDMALGRLLSQGFYTFAHAHSSASQQVFFDVAFEVMGHIAKADGVVTASEIKAAERVMTECGMQAASRQAARQAFRRGKHPQFDLDAALGRLLQVCGHDFIRIHLFLDFQQKAVMADGRVSAKKKTILDRIRKRLGVDRHSGFEDVFGAHFHQRGSGQRHRVQPPSGAQLSQAYQVLGVESDATQAEIKKAYHKKMAQYHPDRLMAKGVPEEMMNVAKEKARAINKAYELIKKQRGFK